MRAEHVSALKGQIAIRQLVSADWPVVERIYLAGIATGDATFETASPGWEQWDSTHLADLRLVVVDGDDRPIAWAAGSPVSERCVYGGVVEDSIYVDTAQRGQGLGKILLRAFIEESERLGYWTLQSGIFPENLASLALHQMSGFRVVGRRERIGQRHGVWRDVIMVERRSGFVGLPFS